jgi:hypothetical protein
MSTPEPATSLEQIPARSSACAPRSQAANPHLPFGGVGPSGTGAYHGRHGFETFSHRKSVVAKPTRFDPAFAYPPDGRIKSAIMRRLL